MAHLELISVFVLMRQTFNIPKIHVNLLLRTPLFLLFTLFLSVSIKDKIASCTHEKPYSKYCFHGKIFMYILLT